MVRVLNPLSHTLSNACHDNVSLESTEGSTYPLGMARGIECDSNYQILSQGVGTRFQYIVRGGKFKA